MVKLVVGKLIEAALTLRLYARLPEYGPVPVLLSVAVSVKLNVPLVVGVPLSVPLLPRLRPAGNAPPVIAKL